MSTLSVGSLADARRLSRRVPRRPRTTAGSGRARPDATSAWPFHQSVGCSATARRVRPEPRIAVTISPSVQARANFQRWSSSSIESRSMYSGAQPFEASGPGEVVVVGRDPAAVGVDVEQPLGRVALEQDEAAARRQQAVQDARPTHRGPAATSASPGPCTAGRPCHRARAACRGRPPRSSGQVPRRPSTGDPRARACAG